MLSYYDSGKEKNVPHSSWNLEQLLFYSWIHFGLRTADQTPPGTWRKEACGQGLMKHLVAPTTKEGTQA